MTFYIKAYWNFRPWERTIRLGFGEGASYAWGIPYVEKLEAQAEGDHNSRFLNYLDISLDFDDMGIQILSPANATALFPGAAVEVFVTRNNFV